MTKSNNNMSKKFLKDSLLWGFVLWLIGYMLGMILFFIVPASLLGWVIMPIGIIITLLVLFKKIKSDSLRYYFGIAIVWALLAIICDYVFLVQILKPADGYYKLDVYLYYIITFVLPLVVGAKKHLQNKTLSK